MIDLAINVTENKNWQVITLKGELDDYQSTKLTKTFLNSKNGNEQLQKVTKNSSIQKVRIQYQTKLGLFMTKSLH